MKKSFSTLLKVFVILFIFSALYIQSSAQSPFFKSYKVFKNKKDYTVNVIYQDLTGYIWFGTTEGLVRFDGIDYTYYTTKDNLFNNNITALFEDKEGYLWIGDAKGGISNFKNNIIEKFEPKEGLSSQPITKLFVDSQNTLWFATEGEGVYYYIKQKDRLYNIWNDEGVSDHAYCFEEDENGNIWIGTDNGISVFNVKDKNVFNVSMKNGLPDNIVKHLEKGNDNIIRIGMEESGIVDYDAKLSKFSNERKLMIGVLNNFVSESKIEKWVSTKSNGVYRITELENGKYEYQYFTEKHGLINNKTTTVFIDRENNLWVGSKNGVSRCNLSTFEFLNDKDGLDAKKVYSLTFTDNNKKWICTEKGLLLVEKHKMGEIKISKILNNSHPNTTFISLFFDSKGYLWAGTYNEGVFRIDPKTFKYKVYSEKEGLANNNVIAISGNDSIIWFSTLGGGVSRCNITQEIKFKTINSKNGLKSDYVYQTFIDKKNRVWFAQDGGGLTLLENNKFTQFDEKTGLITNSVYSITEDEKNNIWIISDDNGIYNFNGNKFTNYTEKDGLKTSIYSGIYNINKELILVSNEGIEIFNTESKSIKYFGEESGVAYLEPNLNSIFVDSQKDIWIGTNNGIIKFDPNEKTNQINPKIVITKKQAYFNEITDSTITLKHNENHLIFNYTGLWFKSPENLLYRHKLEGYDLDWNYVGNSKTQTYSNLPPGTYTFKVMVSHLPDVWIGSNEAEFSFIIKPPFWQTWWFITSTIVFILFLIYLIFRLRLRKLTKDKEELEAEVKRRTAKILNQKEEIESQKEEIEYQNGEIRHSINYAKRIQTALIQSSIEDKSVTDHFVIWKPRDIVSGDFYWIRDIDDKIFYVAADCTGHGVPGAFMSMLGISFLDELILRRNIKKPSEILEELRKQIKQSLSQSGESIEQKDGMDMAIVVFDKKSLEMEYSGAYNPLLLFRNDELIEYKPTRNPVGVYAKEIPFVNNKIQVKKNDVIYIFSDGFVDQFGGEKGQKYKSRRFKEFLSEIHNKQLKTQEELLETELSNWMGTNYSQIDDVLIIGIKVK